VTVSGRSFCLRNSVSNPGFLDVWCGEGAFSFPEVRAGYQRGVLMRRLPTLLLLVLVLSLLAVAPVSADEPVWIAVPDYVAVNGTLDVVVLTGAAPEVLTVVYCFPPGDYPVFKTNIVDKSQRVAGRTDGVIATADVRGNLGSFEYRGTCFESGITYRKYEQVP
jgi:hypothetical protein